MSACHSRETCYTKQAEPGWLWPMAAPEGKDAQPVLEDEIVPEPPPSTLPSEAPQVSWLNAAPQVPRLARALLVPQGQGYGTDEVLTPNLR